MSALLAGERSHAPVLGLGIPEADKLSVAGDRDALLAMAGLSPQAIAERIEAAVRTL